MIILVCNLIRKAYFTLFLFVLISVPAESAAGMTPDEVKEFEGYKIKASKDDPAAQSKLGHCFYNGQGVERDLSEACVWFRKSAEKGFAEAQFRLGNAYEYGAGVPRDFVKAALWYRKAAEQGNVYAQLFLGSFYSNGTGVSSDQTLAAEWTRKAADQGNQYRKPSSAPFMTMEPVWH
jgi:TPR repeat protein